jgi:F-type H+-transporting ATPase subunit delta
MGLLHDKGRIGQLAAISAHLQVLVDEVKNVKRATIVTAGPISEAVQQQVRTTLERLTGHTVFIESKVDPDIIGGIVAQVGDLTLDGSVKTQLKNLKESLIKG